MSVIMLMPVGLISIKKVNTMGKTKKVAKGHAAMKRTTLDVSTAEQNIFVTIQPG